MSAQPIVVTLDDVAAAARALDGSDAAAPTYVPEPETVALALPSDELATLAYDLQRALEDADFEHQRRTEFNRDMLQRLREELANRIRAAHNVGANDAAADRAFKLAHPELSVTLKVSYRLDKRISELRRLYDLLPLDEAKAAVWQEPPPDPADLPWKADARKLKKLARDYAGEVAEVVDRGLVYVEQGAKLVIEARPNQTVTQTAIDGVA